MWVGSFLDICGFPAHKILIQVLKRLWTIQCSPPIVGEFFCQLGWSHSITRVSPSPCHLAVFVMSHEVLSEAPSITMKDQV